MKKCNFCGVELEEEVTLCPACGKELETAEETVAVEENVEAVIADAAEEAPAEEIQEETAVGNATPKKIVMSVIAIVLLLAIIGGILMMGMKPAAQTPVNTESTAAAFEGTIPPDGDPETVTCKGSYTLSDEEAVANGDVIVATMGDHSLTNAQLQIFYWNYANTYLNSENGYMVMMYGMLDYANPLDMQVCAEDPTMTWQQFFLQKALENWTFMQALAIDAENNGYTMSDADRAALEQTPETMEATAVQMGYANAQELMEAQFGAGVTLEDYLYFEELYYNSIPYYNAMAESFTVTEDEVAAFFDKYEAEYAEMGLVRSDRLVDVRHILIMPDGATNANIATETFSEEAWNVALKKAEEILAEYQKKPGEDHFAELANTYTMDGNDANMDGIPDGGLYTDITKATSFVPEFLNWCIDGSRQVGDVEIVKTQYGYHIMYLSAWEELWPMYAEQDALVEKANDAILQVVEANPSNVNYSQIGFAALIMG